MDGKTALPKKIITALLFTMVPQQLMLFLTRDLDNPRSGALHLFLLQPFVCVFL